MTFRPFPLVTKNLEIIVVVYLRSHMTWDKGKAGFQPVLLCHNFVERMKNESPDFT
jgi:hypothetical protein